MADKIDIDKLAELKKGLDGTKESQDRYNKALEQYAEQMKELNKQKKESTILDVQLAQSQAQLAEMFGDSLSAYEANNRALEIAQELYDAAIDSTKELTEAQREQIELVYGNEEALAGEIAALKAKKKAIDALGPAYKKALKTSKPFFEDTAVKLGLLSKKGNKFAKTLGTMFTEAGEKGGLKGLAKGFTEAFNPLNIGISIITKVVESTIAMMFAVDKAGAAFTKTTGFARNFDDLIADTNESMRQFGVSAEDAQKSISALRQGLSQFDTLGRSTQEGLTNLVSGLDKIGVSIQDSSEMISSLNKAFGTNIDQASAMTRELALSGDVLGRTSSKMIKDYTKTLSTLAVYGNKSVKIFKNIATMASAAGVEVDTLMGIANKFDTFSDSAGTAAKMNAILGTSFSGVNMMMMDHDERIKHVIKGLQSTGVAFNKLDKFTQQAVASQLGIKDLNQANKVLSMSTREYERLQEKQAATKKEQDALNKRMKAGVDIMTEIKLIMADFAINMKDFLPTLREMIMGFGNVIKKITPMGLLMTGIGSAMVGLAVNTAGIIAKIKLLEKFGGKAIEGLSKSVASGLNIISTAAATSSAPLGALSISMGGIALVIGTVGAAVMGITWAVGNLFEIFVNGVISLKEANVGFGEVASGILGMAVSIGAVAGAVYGLAAASAALSATGPIGLGLAGVIAGVAGVAFGVGALMSTDGDGPKMDTSDLVNSAQELKGLSQELQFLVDKRSEIEETFAAIGTGLERSRTKMTADIKSTIANVAILATGHAAGEMTDYRGAMALGAMSAMFGPGGAIAALSKGIDSLAGGENNTTKLQLDGDATTALLRGEIAKAHTKTE